MKYPPLAVIALALLASACSEATSEEPTSNDRSEACLHDLALALSDSGNGADESAVELLRTHLGQVTDSKAITLEEALRLELQTFGGQPPASCAHL